MQTHVTTMRVDRHKTGEMEGWLIKDDLQLKHSMVAYLDNNINVQL